MGGDYQSPCQIAYSEGDTVGIQQWCTSQTSVSWWDMHSSQMLTAAFIIALAIVAFFVVKMVRREWNH